MINKKSREEIKRMRHAGHIVALVHQKMREVIEPGISTKELDDIAYRIIKENKAIPTFLGYCGFPGTICASINEQVVHGIPNENVIVKEGDIISVDVGATYGGMVGDGAWTYPVGNVSSEIKRLLMATEEALFEGIKQMREGNVLDDVSKAIERVANREQLGIVRQYGGHGVGHEMHEDPQVPNYGKRGSGTMLKKGMCIAIEPMITQGSRQIVMERDGWTVRTKDRKFAAHFEHTVAVGIGKADILSSFEYIEQVLGDKSI